MSHNLTELFRYNQRANHNPIAPEGDKPTSPPNNSTPTGPSSSEKSDQTERLVRDWFGFHAPKFDAPKIVPPAISQDDVIFILRS